MELDSYHFVTSLQLNELHPALVEFCKQSEIEFAVNKGEYQSAKDSQVYIRLNNDTKYYGVLLALNHGGYATGLSFRVLSEDFKTVPPNSLVDSYLLIMLRFSQWARRYHWIVESTNHQHENDLPDLNTIQPSNNLPSQLRVAKVVVPEKNIRSFVAWGTNERNSSDGIIMGARNAEMGGVYEIYKVASNYEGSVYLTFAQASLFGSAKPSRHVASGKLVALTEGIQITFWTHEKFGKLAILDFINALFDQWDNAIVRKGAWANKVFGSPERPDSSLRSAYTRDLKIPDNATVASVAKLLKVRQQTILRWNRILLDYIPNGLTDEQTTICENDTNISTNKKSKKKMRDSGYTAHHANIVHSNSTKDATANSASFH